MVGIRSFGKICLSKGKLHFICFRFVSSHLLLFSLLASIQFNSAIFVRKFSAKCNNKVANSLVTQFVSTKLSKQIQRLQKLSVIASCCCCCCCFGHQTAKLPYWSLTVSLLLLLSIIGQTFASKQIFLKWQISSLESQISPSLNVILDDEPLNRS